MERTPVGAKTRFEVFKRDSFTCQYCGRKAPEVVLNCDHIHPVAEGGTNDLMNLVTSCKDCNGGKGARLLDQHQALEKARAQMEEINERRIQLEMLAQWQRDLVAFSEDELKIFVERWEEITAGAASLNDRGRDNFRKWRKRFSDEELMEAMTAAAQTYFKRGADGQFEFDSIETAFNFIPRVAMVRRAEKDKPYLRRLYYIRGILRRRLSYLREQDALDLMEEAVHYGIDLDWLEKFAKQVRTWSAFRRSLEQFIEEESADGQNS